MLAHGCVLKRKKAGEIWSDARVLCFMSSVFKEKHLEKNTLALMGSFNEQKYRGDRACNGEIEAVHIMVRQVLQDIQM